MKSLVVKAVGGSRVRSFCGSLQSRILGAKATPAVCLISVAPASLHCM